MERVLEFRLPAALVPPLRELLLPLVQPDARAGLAIAPDLAAIEEDLREAWRADLAAALAEDAARLAAMLTAEAFLAQGTVRLAEADWEPVLRACAAVRLRLRRAALAGIPDASLETGDIKPADLAPEVRPRLAAYLLLATLQEILIAQLDPPPGRGDPRRKPRSAPPPEDA